MYCQKCGQQVPDNASFCQNCGANLEAKPNLNNQQFQNVAPDLVYQQPPKKKKKHGCLVTIIVLAVIFMIFAVLIVSTDTESSGDSLTTTEQVSTTEFITYEEYEQIETGMTYKEVVAIVGCEGKLVSSSDFGDGSTTATYSWSSKDLGGGVTYGATVSFIDNKVEFKQQIGLDIADDVSSAIDNLY